ncbi:MAG: hypothetical protein QOJ53_805, partial [Sphingomonadales bacterium]|nr:hypothetical protein [Sphingomonadales bacterium]
MPAFTPLLTAIVALAAGIWLAVALWAAIRAARRESAARAVIDDNVRLAALLQAGPAMPLVVAADGTISGPDRLAGALGLAALPPRWLALFGEDAPFPLEAAAGLGGHLAEAASGGRFTLTVRPAGSARIFRVDGGPAPAGFAERATLLWFLDVTAAEEDAARLAAQLQRRSEALEALSGLIEAAPFPMWHRGPDLKLVMVNGAYVAAVEAADAPAVIEQGIELVDEGEGAALSHAAIARDSGEPHSRNVPATVAGTVRNEACCWSRTWAASARGLRPSASSISSISCATTEP